MTNNETTITLKYKLGYICKASFCHMAHKLSVHLFKKLKLKRFGLTKKCTKSYFYKPIYKKCSTNVTELVIYWRKLNQKYRKDNLKSEQNGSFNEMRV